MIMQNKAYCHIKPQIIVPIPWQHWGRTKKATPGWSAFASLALEGQPAWASCLFLSHHPELFWCGQSRCRSSYAYSQATCLCCWHGISARQPARQTSRDCNAKCTVVDSLWGCRSILSSQVKLLVCRLKDCRQRAQKQLTCMGTSK